jgi:diketogulonate reductase-like aldo/keto reductase
MERRRFGRSKEKISVIGMGTYYDKLETSPDVFLRSPGPEETSKIEGLKRGLELGINFIDTAEVYLTETLVAEAIRSFRRDDVFLATKVWPNRVSYEELPKAAERSLNRLRTKYIDLYQIHWPSRSVPIRQSMRAMERLVDEGKVRYIGVSNFSVQQTQEAMDSLSRHELVSNQVEYNLLARDVERDILPFSERMGLAVVAYRPLANGVLANPKGKLRETMDIISGRYGKKTYPQIALNWLKEKSSSVFPIPRVSSRERAEENAGAAGWSLTRDDMKLLEAASLS